MTEIIQSLSQIADRYEAVFCDLWGCLHNGHTAYPAAVEALRGFRRRGGVVVLLTNSPKPRREVEKQIARMDVPADCWDVIATSGDSARMAMFQGAVGRRVWFVGQPHDLAFFEPLKILEDPVQIERVGLREAEGIVCCGPEDPHADPSVYRPDFLFARQQGLKMLCANPDIVVDRGPVREWCAGALAQLYEEMGGEALYFGKPHPPVYDLARRRLAKLRPVEDSRILCIGDGIRTDILGGIGEGLDTLFVTGGLAAAEMGPDVENPDPARLAAFLAREQLSPTAAIGRLR
ncbi:MAG: TIGR01459 family HAD-type hydrolase [Rhodobacteraceae bacterium]|nr:TIGR01459 family HAD-type hydrolase [Paracoccaceae bacterium]